MKYGTKFGRSTRKLPWGVPLDISTMELTQQIMLNRLQPNPEIIITTNPTGIDLWTGAPWLRIFLSRK
jgi:hypothetical protein